MSEENIKINELITIAQDGAIGDNDRFAIDRQDAADSSIWSSYGARGQNIKKYVLEGNGNRDVGFRTVSGSINAMSSDGTTRSALVNTMASSSDSSDNAASTRWVNNFWNGKASGDNRISGKWEFDHSLAFRDLKTQTGRVLISDTASTGKIKTSEITVEELNYIGSLTGSVQEQLNSKASRNNPTLSGIIEISGTLHTTFGANKILCTDNTHNVVVSGDSSKLMYLSSVNSDIQSQLDDKISNGTANERFAYANNAVLLQSGLEARTVESQVKFAAVSSTTINIPPSDSNDTSFATTYWVRGHLNCYTTTTDFTAHTGNDFLHLPTVNDTDNINSYLSLEKVENRIVPSWKPDSNFCPTDTFTEHITSTTAHLPTRESGTNFLCCTGTTAEPIWKSISEFTPLVISEKTLGNGALIIAKNTSDDYYWWSMEKALAGGLNEYTTTIPPTSGKVISMFDDGDAMWASPLSSLACTVDITDCKEGDSKILKANIHRDLTRNFVGLEWVKSEGGSGVKKITATSPLSTTDATGDVALSLPKLTFNDENPLFKIVNRMITFSSVKHGKNNKIDEKTGKLNSTQTAMFNNIDNYKVIAVSGIEVVGGSTLGRASILSFKVTDKNDGIEVTMTSHYDTTDTISVVVYALCLKTS